ncbi:MAG TPA: YicC/YloC family endoribonuclease, partial [Burkholderiaceae bacterium]
MTGYAAATAESEAGTLTLEIKSVNSRFLDLQFRINDDLRALEPALRETLMSKVTRGKVEVRVSFGRKTADSDAQALNATALAQLARLQNEVRLGFADAAPLSIGEVLRWPGVIVETQLSTDKLQADANALMASVLAAFLDSRAREGAALEAMLLDRISKMEEIVKKVAPLMPQIVAAFQQKAVDRMREALGIAADGATTQTV